MKRIRRIALLMGALLVAAFAVQPAVAHDSTFHGSDVIYCAQKEILESYPVQIRYSGVGLHINCSSYKGWGQAQRDAVAYRYKSSTRTYTRVQVDSGSWIYAYPLSFTHYSWGYSWDHKEWLVVASKHISVCQPEMVIMIYPPPPTLADTGHCRTW